MVFDRVTHGEQFLPGTSAVGVLVLHGFTSTTASVIDWARAIHGARDTAGRGPAVSVPLLPGHGTSWQQLRAQRWQQWRDAVDREYWRLRAEHDAVVVAGLSMGGALALELAARRPVAGVLLVNPALALRSRAAAFSALLRYVVHSVPGFGSDISRPGTVETTYDRTPVAAVAQLNLVLRRALRTLPAVTSPCVVFRSGEDHVVADASVRLLQERSGGPVRVIPLPDSFHVATLDHDRGIIEADSRRAVERLLRGEDFAGPPARGGGS